MVIQKKTYGHDAYKNTEVSTADQKKLIILLYDGAIRFMKIAIDNMSPKKYDIVNTNIIKTQDIITELMMALDMNLGGEVASNLFNIYAYIKKRLLEANVEKNSKILLECTKHLTELREAWSQVNFTSEMGKREIKEGVGLSIRG